MISNTNLRTSFRGLAIPIATYLLKRVSSKSIDKIPYEIWKGKTSSLPHLKIWGCCAYVKHTQANKLKARSIKCKFAGYPKETLGYYLYNPKEQKLFVSKHAMFLEIGIK